MQLILVLLVTALSLVGLGISQDSMDTLMNLQVFFHHGVSVPQKPSSLNDTCPTKRATNYSNITQVGVDQVQSLGFFLRSRYDDFICNNNYICSTGNTSHFTMISSNVMSCNESAQVLLNTLFNLNVNHTTPTGILMTPTIQEAVSLDYDSLQKNWSLAFPQNTTYQTLMQQVDKTYSVPTIQDLVSLANYTVYEEAASCSLQSWLQSVSSDLGKLYDDYFSSFPKCQCNEIVTNATNILRDTILKQFDSSLDKNTTIYSMQADNMAVLMTRLKVFDVKHIPFGAALYMELHNISNIHVVRFFYDNTSDHVLTQLQVSGCDMDCPVSTFTRLTKELANCASGESSLQSFLFLVFFAFAFSFFQAKLNIFS